MALLITGSSRLLQRQADSFGIMRSKDTFWGVLFLSLFDAYKIVPAINQNLPPLRRACPSHIGLSRQRLSCRSGLSLCDNCTRVELCCANRGKSEFVHHVRECVRRGFRGRPESPLNKSHSIRLFAGGLRKNSECILRRGTPSLAGRPLFQTVHRTV
jgi:hypothetical protein